MHAAARPWAAAGVALVAAGAIAVGPAPSAEPLPRTVAGAAIELSALPSWLQWVSTGTTVLNAQIAAIANVIQNEIDEPVPILSTIARNLIVDAQDVGGAGVTAAQVVISGLVSAPNLLLNAAFDAIANPLAIPAILAGLVSNVVSVATSAITPVTAALSTLVSTTLTRAIGVANAVIANLGSIGGALIGVPVAIGNALVGAAVSVAGSVLTLNPFNVISAAGDAVVNVEAVSVNSVATVFGAVGKLRADVRAAVAFPLPAAALPAAPRAARAPSGAPARSRAASAVRSKAAAAAGHSRPDSAESKPSAQRASRR